MWKLGFHIWCMFNPPIIIINILTGVSKQVVNFPPPFLLNFRHVQFNLKTDSVCLDFRVKKGTVLFVWVCFLSQGGQNDHGGSHFCCMLLTVSGWSSSLMAPIALLTSFQNVFLQNPSEVWRGREHRVYQEARFLIKPLKVQCEGFRRIDWREWNLMFMSTFHFV